MTQCGFFYWQLRLNFLLINCCHSLFRERQARLREVLLPVVPPKLSQSLRGPAFVDYLSSMSQISQLENMQLSECKASSKQRR